MEQKNIKNRKIIDRLLTVLLVLSVIFFIFSKVFALSRISGSSMYPTYEDKEYVLCNRFLKTEDYKRGDVITFYSGEKYLSNIYIKRIAAIPGDTVLIKDGVLYVNGEKQNTCLPPMQDAGIAEKPLALGKDEFFVLGDNRNRSRDSRIIGPVKMEKIIGRVYNQREPKIQ